MYSSASNNYNNWPTTARNALEYIGTIAFASLGILALL